MHITEYIGIFYYTAKQAAGRMPIDPVWRLVYTMFCFMGGVYGLTLAFATEVPR